MKITRRSLFQALVAAPVAAALASLGIRRKPAVYASWAEYADRYLEVNAPELFSKLRHALDARL